MSAAATGAGLRRARLLLAAHAGLALDSRHDAALEGALERVLLPAPGAMALGADEYLDACEREPSAGGPLGVLARALLVRETHVFRTRADFDALETVVFPELLARRAAERRLVAWSAGCSTGEETWSLAFSLIRAAAAAGIGLGDWDVTILGSDVDPSSIETARAGTYGEYSFRGTGDHERERFFERAERDGAFRVRDAFRACVSFRRHDLVREPPALPGADLVLCRNVLMYLTPEASLRVLAGISGALASGGWLMTGAAEHALAAGLGLEAMPLPGALAWRKPAASIVVSLPAPAVAAALEARSAGPFLEALEERQDDPDACLLLGRQAADAGRGREAEAWLARALQLRPEDPDAAYLLALVLSGRGAAGAALREAARACELRPGFVMALQLLSRLRREAGDPRGAGHALDEALVALASLPDDATVPHAHDIPAGHLRSALAALRGGRGATP